MKRPSADDCPPGWALVDGEAARALEAELALEVQVGHALHGLAATALAQSALDDDALFALADDRLALVTLSWSERPETPPMPATRILASRDDWSRAAAPADEEFGDELDLHLFSPRDAATLVRDFVDHWARNGPREVRIVHGKGIGAMRELVHGILASHPAVTRFALASDRSGWGATVATIAAWTEPAPGGHAPP